MRRGVFDVAGLVAKERVRLEFIHKLTHKRALGNVTEKPKAIGTTPKSHRYQVFNVKTYFTI